MSVEAGIKQVEPSSVPFTYNAEDDDSKTNQKDNGQFNTRNPDQLLNENQNTIQLYEGKIVSFINNLRSKVLFIDKCFMVLGLLIFIAVALVSFVLMLPLMIWIVLGFLSMIFAAIFTICLRAYCPGRIYNILIDIFNIPHQKT